ncbi:MAG: response regulator transcription factor [Saprospiraceae bacterium]
MLKVLLIEDEVKLLNSLKQGLEENQIEVETARDGEIGMSLLDKNDYHVVVSDVLMPGISGIQVLKKLRASGKHTPFIFLSALNHTDDKIEGLEAGADDYLPKPFEFKELLLRIKALARRPAEIKQTVSEILTFGDLELRYKTKEAFRKSANLRIPLTPKEFALLEYFILNPERVISKNELSEKVWNMNFDTGTNIVEVYVNFLRKKIDRPDQQKLIHTVFKTGYILNSE